MATVSLHVGNDELRSWILGPEQIPDPCAPETMLALPWTLEVEVLCAGDVAVVAAGIWRDRENAECGGSGGATAPSVPVLNTAGMLSLIETAAAMDHCRVIVTNDSGLMHIAAARRRRIVAIFGSTVRQFGFYPPADRSIVVEEHGLECRPCTPIGRASCPRGHFRCMQDITPGRVSAAASAFMNAT